MWGMGEQKGGGSKYVRNYGTGWGLETERTSWLAVPYPVSKTCSRTDLAMCLLGKTDVSQIPQALECREVDKKTTQDQ